MAEVEDSVWAKGFWWRDDLSRSAGPSRPERFPVRWLILGTAFVLPMVIPGVRNISAADAPVWVKALMFAVLFVYSACYLSFPLFMIRFGLPARIFFCTGMVALGWCLIWMWGIDAIYQLIYALGIVGFALPIGPALILDVGSLLAALAVILVGKNYDKLGDLTTVASVTGAMFMFGRLIRAIRSLRKANEDIADLAVANERERVARDLHDILGHSLTTITVKAGLARRILESSADPAKAITEIHEVEGLARSALSDVRLTVSDYREVSLSAELAGARVALRAAEIDADLPHAVDDVQPDLQRTFGYVLREAVTNVVRHSGARHVTVRLGRTWLEIADDGAHAQDIAPGNGLRGLEERLAQVGGTVRAGSRPGGGFVVRAEVPS
ncbi:two-component system, NarL family, sensor histidine kinase DesK [Amycolatopsis xylanica]|uniref:Two-component system, NarL family, sensor histidine kinase DesK n=1 Tax=Amycolatopsis xylanica TaxID=589385 RepID=A0A1H3H7F8_9PSEU|nr:sensor histidine kinase [Amycolatopsis xylanica]SDY11452.1 two-component system, NarL family, sensor histidine kinase DesK [Amycolatopsis xylanica]